MYGDGKTATNTSPKKLALVYTVQNLISGSCCRSTPQMDLQF